MSKSQEIINHLKINCYYCQQKLEIQSSYSECFNCRIPNTYNSKHFVDIIDDHINIFICDGVDILIPLSGQEAHIHENSLINGYCYTNDLIMTIDINNISSVDDLFNLVKVSLAFE